MQQFALTLTRPRSIAWLIGLDEWERLEIIVKYNCAMLGGYYNVLIPLNEENAISEKYRQFLVDFDPDLIVLAPNTPPSQIDFLSQQLHAFCLVHWDEVAKVALLDPMSGTPNSNVTMGNIFPNLKFPNALIAVADDMEPDTSKLALIACGDIQPRDPYFQVFNGDVELDAHGYREEFLSHYLNSEYKFGDVIAHLDEDLTLTPAPDNYELNYLIEDTHCFPLVGTHKILSACYRLQHSPTTHASFIGLTTLYATSRGAPKRVKRSSYSLNVILVSEHFDLEEAILFWNLRAMEMYVSWLPFSAIENRPEELVSWIDSNNGGGFYTMFSLFQVTFSTNLKNLPRLEKAISKLEVQRSQHSIENIVSLDIRAYDEIIFYDYIRPSIKQEHVPIIKHGDKLTFIPQSPSEGNMGSYALDLEYANLMFPQSLNLTDAWQRLYEREYYCSVPYKTTDFFSWRMPYCRVCSSHYLRFQVDKEGPIETNTLSTQDTVAALFQHAGFSRIEQSSTAKYHTIFLERAGGLEQAVYYLADPPYRSLLETLVDEKDENKIGWLLKNPDKKRAFNHLDLWKIVNKPILFGAENSYIKSADKLPEEIFSLLERRLLERGFEIKCRICGFKSWYPADLIGQDFTCARCFQTQVYQSNPLWLYKLPEAIFQGFNNHMQVPLLALDYMKRKSKLSFDWIPDSDVFQMDGQKEELVGNVDIICLCDGEFYIGEAKSSANIEEKQFSFYRQICQKVAIDGIIFATSQKHWDNKTSRDIDALKQNFSGKVLILTEEDLYDRQ